MLKLKKIDFFRAPVPVSFPTEDATKREEGSFTATFKYLSKPAFDAVMKQIAEKKITDEQIAKDVLIAVDGIGDEHGAPLLPKDQVAAVHDDVILTGAVVKAFFESYRTAATGNASK